MKRNTTPIITHFKGLFLLCLGLFVAVQTFSQTDNDGDGFGVGVDCNDNDACTYPGAMEFCDNIDNDCDGMTDEDISTIDNDGDGFSQCDGDCDDQNVSINSNGIEIPNNGIDEDCSCLDLVTTGLLELNNKTKTIVAYYDLLGKPCAFEYNTVLLVRYTDGTYGKSMQTIK